MNFWFILNKNLGPKVSPCKILYGQYLHSVGYHGLSLLHPSPPWRGHAVRSSLCLCSLMGSFSHVIHSFTPQGKRLMKLNAPSYPPFMDGVSLFLFHDQKPNHNQKIFSFSFAFQYLIISPSMEVRLLYEWGICYYSEHRRKHFFSYEVIIV